MTASTATTEPIGVHPPSPAPAAGTAATATAHHGFLLPIVGAAAIAHLLNDAIQAMLPAIFPLLKTNFTLSYAEIGLIALVYQLTASILQPWIGLYTDKYPKPYLLPSGMCCTFIGIGVLAIAPNYATLLLAAAIIGIGSATFHPEASRIARLASGGRFGTAQSTFQVGGNAGSAIGPLLAAAIIIPIGQKGAAWFMLVAALASVVLYRMTVWVIAHGASRHMALAKKHTAGLDKSLAVRAIVVICILMFTKFIYIALFTNFFTFYLIERFALNVQQSQLFLFVFLASVAIGTFAGGPVGDRIGRRAVIWTSFLGVIPFALVLPHANLFWTAAISIGIGLVMSSAFAAMVVYAQEAAPGRVGMVSGLMFGLMFGISGIGAAGLGLLADMKGIIWVYQVMAWVPLLGMATFWLPKKSS
ncbi:MFS transporter [Lampropedia puyangensis]|uniref:MFS transporter n=1 Tax=Lampropedia puyangensis TaxID=1330072 RepID=A0A4S8F6Z6_9BURK|nr:MFS transporter [Lampropedia puyangensis]THU02859.1 MFS transporter [Lampropedia puyangensis]